MRTPEADTRIAERRALDEKIASEPPLAPPEIPADAVPLPVEACLVRLRKRAMEQGEPADDR